MIAWGYPHIGISEYLHIGIWLLSVIGISVCGAKIYAVFAVSPLEGFGVSNLRFDGTKSNYWRFGKFAYICGAELC